MSFITITNTAGAAAAVNPALVAGLVPVVVGASPITRIMLATGAGETYDTVTPYIDVPLSVAATIVALTTGAPATGAGVLAFGLFSGATGALVAGFGFGFLAGARLGAGDYTATLAAVPPAGALPIAGSASGDDHGVTWDGPIVGAVIAVKSFNTAGVADDATYVLAVFVPT